MIYTNLDGHRGADGVVVAEGPTFGKGGELQQMSQSEARGWKESYSILELLYLEIDGTC
jgi:hypothetical protein